MNDYSNDWIDTFLATVDPAQTQCELEFLQRQLPLDRFPRVLDVCCGLGRHAGALASLGYDVTGIDRDPKLIAQAQLAHPRARFLALDAMDIASLNESFDAIICMWQSFGFGTSTENDELLQQIAQSLRREGRFVLDIYNREFFTSRQGTLTSQRNGRVIRETKTMHDGRLRVELTYDDDTAKSDMFDWEIFSEDEIAERAAQRQMKLITTCTMFDERTPVSDASPRMQLVFEKTA